MTNRERTVCPCCGAPCIATEKEVTVPTFEGNLRGWGYTYEEPKQDIKVMGYNVQDLIVTAELLRTHNLAPQDLRDMMHNLGLAMSVARTEYDKMIQQCLEEMTKSIYSTDEVLKTLNRPPAVPLTVEGAQACAEYVNKALEKAAKEPHKGVRL